MRGSTFGVCLVFAAMSGCSGGVAQFKPPPPLDTSTAEIVRDCRQDAAAHAETSTRKENRGRVASAAYSDCLTRRGVPR
jgi:hypothetical protein